MLRLKHLIKLNKSTFNSSRTYLSDEFKGVMLSGPELPYLEKGRSGQSPRATDILNSFSTLTTRKDSALIDFHMQSRIHSVNIFDSTNYAIVRQLLNNGNVEDLTAVIKNRTDFGIFLNQFEGCFLIDHFLETDEHQAAAQIALDLVQEFGGKSNLTNALSVKAFFEYLQGNAKNPSTPADDTNETEVKVRVKFLRNTLVENADLATLIGRVAVKLCHSCPDNIGTNIKVIGLVITNQNKELTDLLNSKAAEVIGSDTLSLCLQIEKSKKNADEELVNVLNHNLEKNEKSETFVNMLEAYIKNALSNEEQNLVKDQLNRYKLWQEDSHDYYCKKLEKESAEQRQQNIDGILKKIEVDKQKLWYFEQEDKIDLEIFSKIKIYPKRWFGKKKKPKVIDDDYIPPEVVTKSSPRN